MPKQNILETDWSTIDRRRQLARQRQEREKERRALLVDTMKVGRRAEQLRTWLADKKGIARSDPAAGRMYEWARQQLLELEAMADPARLAQIIVERDLFPEIDRLHDPLGEPPARQPWGR